MKTLPLLLIALALCSISFAQQDSTDYVDPNYKAEKSKEPKTKKPMSNRVYFGGTFGLGIGIGEGSSTSILVEPLVGFKMTEKLSTGIGIGYRYTSGQFTTGQKFSYSNYLGRIFSRYIIIPKLYAHVEFMAENYDNAGLGPYYLNPITGEITYPAGRTTVPFLFVGGGYRSQGSRGSLIFQVLFNVLQSNENSSTLYPAGIPYITIGYIGGF